MRKTVRFITAFVNLAVLLLMGVAGYYINKLPDSYYVGRGENLEISSLFEVTAENSRGELVRSSNIGEAALDEEYTLKLFGVIPLKSVTVRAVDAPLVVPGGTPFGIKLLTDGVVVIGIGEVGTAGGPVCPAANAGIKTGDVIVTIKGKKVASNQDIADIISKSGGKPMKVVFRRNGREETALITPAYSAKDGAYKAGVWVRDSTAGIGTVTFYDPETGAFGGLGHPVCDADTGQILPLSSGEAVSVAILGVKKGEAGAPGELVGNFTSLSSEGTLTLNSSCGIFGTLKKAPSLSSPIPIAMRQDIRCGDATILTTVSGTEPKEYSIKIEKISMKEDSTRNMIIRITDPELLSSTGGIVQGMSGSPIIQDGKLIGAVTHVFVSDPTKGYGVFADAMYEKAMCSAEKKAA